MSFRSLNIAPRAVLCFALVTLLVVALGAFSLVRLGDLFTAEQDIENGWMKSVQASDRMQKDLLHVRLETLRLLATDDNAAVAETDLSSIRKYRADFDAVAKHYDADLVGGDEERLIFQRVRAALAAYLAEQQQVVDLNAQHQTEQALQLVNGSLRAKGGSLEGILEELSQFNQTGAKQAGLVAGETYDHGRIGVMVTIAIAVVLTVLLALLLTRSIVNPINQAPCTPAASRTSPMPMRWRPMCRTLSATA